MKANKLIFLLFISLSLILVSCGDDDDPTSASASITGTYSGTTSQDQPASVTVNEIDGEAYVTSYSMYYEYNSGGTTISGSFEHSNSQGIIEISDNDFVISLGAESDNQLEGSINSETLEGGFNYYVSPSLTTSATFTLTKE